MSMIVDGLNASGTLTYKLQGHVSLDLGGRSFKTDAMEISGQVSAQGRLLGIPTSVTETLGGIRYSQNSGMSLVKDDLTTVLNISLGSTPVQLLSRTESGTITTYSPPYLSEFDHEKTGSGDSWTETTRANTTISVNGTAFPLISTQVTYIVQVAPSRISVTTEAGAFNTLQITVAESNGVRTVFWWSERVQNFVVEKKYGPGASQPDMMLTLKEFESPSSAETTITVMVGVALIIIAVTILAVILGVRRPRRPVNQVVPPPDASPPA